MHCRLVPTSGLGTSTYRYILLLPIADSIPRTRLCPLESRNCAHWPSSPVPANPTNPLCSAVVAIVPKFVFNVCSVPNPNPKTLKKPHPKKSPPGRLRVPLKFPCTVALDLATNPRTLASLEPGFPSSAFPPTEPAPHPPRRASSALAEQDNTSGAPVFPYTPATSSAAPSFDYHQLAQLPSPQTPPRKTFRSISGGAGPSALASSSQTYTSGRKTSSASHAPSARSFEFASDRSPLQKLELELKHISKEEPDVPGLTRSLSKRQEERLQRSTTVTSRITSRSSSKVPERTGGAEDSRSHRPSNRHRMPHIFGHHLNQEANDAQPKADGMSKPHEKPPHHESTLESWGRVIGEHLHHHHKRPPSVNGDGLDASLPTGAEQIDNTRVAHLTLEDAEIDGIPQGGDAAEDDYGMTNFHRGQNMSPISPDAPSGDTSSGPRHSSKQRRSTDSAGEKKRPPHHQLSADNGVFSSSIVQPLSSNNLVSSQNDPPISSSPPSKQPLTAEEKQDELIFSYIRAVPPRVAPEPTTFSPSLNVKCGPLLRYLGLRRDGTSSLEGMTSAKEERETWRGSIMIVTTDELSDYSPPPVVRLFVQPVPQMEIGKINSDVGSEFTTMTATGEKKAVKPPAELPGKKDMSRDKGLLFDTEIKSKGRDGEKIGKYREVEAIKLHAERGVTFWRFNIEVELGDKQSRIAYRINHGPSIAFWVPARGETMNIMFHSCNGFSLSVNPDEFCGPDPLWRDVVRSHQTKPFHVMLGGGDQVYNDAVAKQTTHFRDWLAIKVPFQKAAQDFTQAMADELEEFYLERYSMWFSQGLFGVANAQIPMVNIWDDHDIIDGFGSYPNHFNKCPVFTGLGTVAFKYYMLFQHQSLVHEKEEHEPSWLLGAAPGPYIAELSRSCFMNLGRKVALLGLDCRMERMRDVVVSERTYVKVFERLRKEVIKGETKHLLVLLGVPIAYPRLVWLENLLTSRLMDPLKALGRMGLLGGFINTFDGGVELLDDLDDHWTAKNHKAERNQFIKQLQEFAAEKSVRVTLLGGDVHLAGIGQFYSNPRLKIPRKNDHRYMPNVISSAIVNTPPPNTMADILNKRNKIHHLDDETDEDMYPIFPTDVDGKPRNNKRLLPRRNYAVINSYVLGDSATSSIDQKPKKKSTFSKIKRASFKKSQKTPSTESVVLGRDMDGAGASTQDVDLAHLRQDALEVSLRMEINQADPSGTTKPYRLVVPALDCEVTVSDSGLHANDHHGWI